MKICFCIDTLDNGGAERVVSTLANELSNQHETYILITSYWQNNPFYDIKKGVQIIKSTSKIKGMKSIRFMKNVFKQIKPDVVISFLPQNNAKVFLASIFKKNFVHIVSERNNPYIDPQNKLMRLLKKISFAKADGCVFQTKDAMDFFKRIPLKKKKVIFNPTCVPEVYWKENDRNKSIISVGRLVEQKNFPCLINAFSIFSKNHPDFDLHIIGDGPEKNKLKELVLNLNLSSVVYFDGIVNNWGEKYVDSSMFVCSSDYEGMPNALLEAMCLGIPCISTDCPIGGPRELIKDKNNGYLFPVGDFNKLSDLMEDALNKSFIKENFNLRNKLSSNNIAKQWMDFINDIISEAK